MYSREGTKKGFMEKDSEGIAKGNSLIFNVTNEEISLLKNLIQLSESSLFDNE